MFKNIPTTETSCLHLNDTVNFSSRPASDKEQSAEIRYVKQLAPIGRAQVFLFATHTTDAVASDRVLLAGSCDCNLLQLERFTNQTYFGLALQYILLIVIRFIINANHTAITVLVRLHSSYRSYISGFWLKGGRTVCNPSFER